MFGFGFVLLWFTLLFAFMFFGRGVFVEPTVGWFRPRDVPLVVVSIETMACADSTCFVDGSACLYFYDGEQFRRKP